MTELCNSVLFADCSSTERCVYCINQSKKCFEKSRTYLNNKDVDMAMFYNKASEGYKIKAKRYEYEL